MIWRRLAVMAGNLRAAMMVEIDRNPLAVRQGAAAAACIALAAAAMPVIAHRAEEQREGADRAEATRFAMRVAPDLFTERAPEARIELVALREHDGLRARGQGLLPTNAVDTHAMLVRASLRGPSPEALAAPGAVNPRELRCLSEAVYYEARGESYTGQVAVAEVVVNRARSRHYPRSVCGVVYQGSHRSTGCQFSFTCDGSMNRGPHGEAWRRAQHVARQVLSGFERPVTLQATHYHTTAVRPVWSSTLVETNRIGAHIFYRFPNASERETLVASGAYRRARRYAEPETAAAPEPDGVDSDVAILAPPPEREADGVAIAPGAAVADGETIATAASAPTPLSAASIY